MKYIPEEHEKYKCNDDIYRFNGRKYILLTCKYCGELCLCREKNKSLCSYACNSKYKGQTNESKRKISKANKGRRHNEEVKKKISDATKGKKLSDETKRKMSEAQKGDKCYNWRGGVKKLNLPLYDTYSINLDIECRRSCINTNLLEVKCFCCGNWFIPKMESVRKYIKYKKGISNCKNNLYCSNKCRKISKKGNLGDKNGRWMGGVIERNIPVYSTYANKLTPIEECRKTEEGYLELRCTYCGKWYMPKRREVECRIYGINSGDYNRLYCSSSCKKQCPIYGKSPETLMREDAVRAGRILPEELNREVQSELRWMVLERDNYTCQICGSTHNLHCHHYEGIWQNQLESADIDNCVTLCKSCHIKVHKQPGCTYYDMRKKYC